MSSGRRARAAEEVKSRALADDEVRELAPDAFVLSLCGIHPDRYRPDVIYRNPAWADLPALRQGRVFCVPEAFLGRPGPGLPQGAGMRQLSGPALRIARLVRKELRQLFRDPRTKLVIFVSPVLQLVLFGYAVNTDVRRVATWVVDHDRTAESRLLLEAFTASDYFRVVGASDDPDDLERTLDRGDAKVGMRIPAGFARDVRAGRSPAVQLLLDGSNSNTATVAQGYAARIIQQLAVRWAPAGVPVGGVDLRARAWTTRGWSHTCTTCPPYAA